jgi:hypothetical protein
MHNLRGAAMIQRACPPLKLLVGRECITLLNKEGVSMSHRQQR